MKNYPLSVENIGEDTYCLMSKGHHDIHEFMREVRKEGYDWPLGVPEHTWFHCTPDRTGNLICRYSEVPEGTRGAFPVTVVVEAYGSDAYEAANNPTP